MKKHLLAAITFFCGTLSLLAQIPTNGLVAKWDFDTRLTSKFGKDELGLYPLSNYGVDHDNPRLSTDSSSALFGNVTGSYMSVNNANFRQTSFSISTWFKTAISTPYHTIANVRINTATSPFNSYNLSTGSSTSNKLTFFFTTNLANDLQVQNNWAIPTGIWTHAVVTCSYNVTVDSTTVILYINNVLEDQLKVKGSIAYPVANPLVLGNVIGATNGNGLRGNLDDFMFYNRPLTALEVSDLYSGANIPSTGLVSHWKFNQARIMDDSYSNYKLTNNGAVRVIGKSNIDSTAAYFPGSANMNINNSVFRSSTFSISTWYKWYSSSNSYNTLASVRINPASAPYNSYNLSIGTATNGKLTFYFSTQFANDIQIQNPSITTTNVWAHSVITCNHNAITDSSVVKMYVNSILVAQTKVKGSITYPVSNPLVLGSVTGAPTGNSLYGSLDEFLFYNREISPMEISNIYNGTTTGISSPISNTKSEMFLYPNPTSTILNIEVKEQTQISIINILGEVVKTEMIHETSSIDVSQLHAGVYFVQDTKSGKAIKFIKE